MSEIRISAEARTEFGKGFARRRRAAGKIPASCTATASRCATCSCRATT